MKEKVYNQRMLDWERRIDNDKKFQDLVNEIFAWEINRPGLKPSSSYIGADGGWDGRYEGSYLGDDGLFSFQAKWTKKNGDQASRSLATEIKGHKTKKGELQKAKANGVNHLFIATNAELNIGTHIPHLEGLVTDEVDHLYVYHRAKLAQLIERYPWIQYRYFDFPTKPLFCPTDAYFEQCEPDLFLTPELLSFKREVIDVENFIRSRNKVLVIHAPAGRGKTRLLYHLATQTVPQIGEGWIPLFCRTSLRAIEDALNDEVLDSKKYVIFVDNADITPEKTKSLLEAVRFLDPQKFKLILTCRTENHETLLADTEKVRLQNVSTLVLSPLPFEEQLSLLEKVSGKAITENVTDIAKGLGNNLHSIVQYGTLLSEEKVVSSQDIEKSLVTEVKEQSKILDDLAFTQADQDILLTTLSANVPFRVNDTRSMSLLSKITQKDEEKLKTALEKLKESGVLRIVGSAYRFSTDLKGNTFLFYSLSPQIINRDFVKDWLAIDSKRLSYNLGIAYLHTKNAHLHEIFKDLVNEITLEASSLQPSARTKTLEWLKNVAHIVPKEVINCLYAFMKESDGTINRDDFGPVLTVLVRMPGLQSDTLQIVRNMAKGGTKGLYSNFEPKELLRQSVSPLSTRSIDTAIQSLNILELWATEDTLDPVTLELIHEGITEALAGSHAFTESKGNTITHGYRRLNYTPKVQEYRNTALLIVDKLLLRNDYEVTKQTVGILHEVGKDSHTKEGELWERIMEDFDHFLNAYEKLLSDPDQDIRIVAEIEDQLFRLWGNNHVYPTLEERVKKLLLLIPKTPELLTYKLLTDTDFVIPDNKALIDSAPKSEIWSWLVHNHMHRFNNGTSVLESAVQELSLKYNTKELLITYLNDLSSKIVKTHWSYTPLVETWSKYKKELILSVATNSEDLSKVPQRFKDGFQIVASEHVSDYLEGFAKDLLQKDVLNPVEGDQFINLIQVSKKPALVFANWLSTLVTKLDSNGLRVFMNRFPRLFAGQTLEEKQLLITVLEKVLEIDTHGETIDSFDFFIHHLKSDPDLEKLDLSTFKKELYKGTVRTKRFDYHEQSILDFILNKDIQSLIDFIEVRLKFEKSANDRQYDAIPHSGFDNLKDYIHNYTDFKTFMSKVSEWHEADYLYNFEIDSLTEHLLSLKDEKGDFQTRYLEEKAGSEELHEIKSGINALYGIEFGKENADLFLSYLKKTEDTSLKEEAESAFVQRVLSGSISGTIGEIPAEWTRKKEALAFMKSKADPGRIKVLIESLERQIDQDIKSNLEEAEEIMDPKE